MKMKSNNGNGGVGFIGPLELLFIGLKLRRMREFIRERDEAFTAFILTGNKKPVIKYCKKYKVHMPKDERVFAAGIYKAALNCNGIEKYVKDLAFRKCIELGFSPYIDDDYEYLNDESL